jgi:proteasome lid subunit RPN8/RPN11
MEIGEVTRYDQPRRVKGALAPGGKSGVLIRTEAVLEMYVHAEGEMRHEVGGYLLGFPIADDAGRRATYIELAVRAIYQSTPTYVRMEADSFLEVEAIRERENLILVGYYHSHPHLDVFQSATDVRNFKRYHGESYQIAVVVDPSKTSRAHLYEDSDWIGYFGWREDGFPRRLSPAEALIVNARPEVAEDAEDSLVVSESAASAELDQNPDSLARVDRASPACCVEEDA